jgi:divinyl chlorophyllide a 8-vinyl-reductase
MTFQNQTILLAGATGTIGQAVARALVTRGARVICPVRQGSEARLPAGVTPVVTDMTQEGLAALTVDCDGVISCLASRTGRSQDAWAIDHAAHLGLLAAAKRAGAKRFVLLSAICVQRPKLEFQRAKLAFEAALAESGMPYTIVRPTAYFKSLSGQLARLKAGKPFLVFGDGTATACKPISDRDLARFIIDSLDDPGRLNRICPIGGPGPALTARAQGELLFKALGQAPAYRKVPFAVMDVIVAGCSLAGLVSTRARNAAEMARIGRYYATESMLVWDEKAQRYDAEATPETGSDRLADFYKALADGTATVDLGDHAVF